MTRTESKNKRKYMTRPNMNYQVNEKQNLAAPEVTWRIACGAARQLPRG